MARCNPVALGEILIEIQPSLDPLRDSTPSFERTIPQQTAVDWWPQDEVTNGFIEDSQTPIYYEAFDISSFPSLLPQPDAIASPIR